MFTSKLPERIATTIPLGPHSFAHGPTRQVPPLRPGRALRVARKRRHIGSARRDAIPGMPSRARTSGWRTVAHGALLRRPAPLKSLSASRLASPSHTKIWAQRGRHSGTRTAPWRPTVWHRTLRRWVTRLAGAQRSCRAREEGWGRHCTGCDRRERCLRVRHRSLLTWASCM